MNAMRRRHGARSCAVFVAAVIFCGALPVGAQATPHVPPVEVRSSDTTDSSDAVAAAARDYRSNGVARTVAQGDFLVFPFGHAQPTLTCAVLRACIIELQSGEILLSRIAGDTERWEFASAFAGGEGKTVLVVVKPRECDVTTNLVLATDRRVYDLALDSPPCRTRATNPQQAYVRHVRFYYPDETVTAWTKAVPPETASVRVDLAALNFRYEVRKDKQFPWSPSQVFDDGTRVYIKLPEQARHTEVPVLFALESDGSKSLLNYSLVDDDTYVTDRLFDRAALVSGSDGKERQLVITRKSDDR